ncbi:MAG: type I DNA topoisomerase [Alphaproteobacteria bacterium]|jgi:DNA topoisomerase I|nr:type I DNA topoisomerase [Alphaproteobacteria bacterium]
MSQTVLVVESPAKAGTIQGYLKKIYPKEKFTILASYGHVRDLIPKTGAVDVEHDFAMKYAGIERNQKHVDRISKELKPGDRLLLATDPDREGEAIAWHLLEMLKEKKAIDKVEVGRVVFHSITRATVEEEIKNIRTLSQPLIDAQQARRALDYLVGFTLSPLLWKKIKTGLSAGRVQSPALRMIVERELEIEAFKSKEYWSFWAHCLQKKQGTEVAAKLISYQGKELKQFSLTSKEQVEDAKQAIIEASGNKLQVGKIENKNRKRNPLPPFMTSTLLQEAARKLGFSAIKTMRVAQQLYEGIELKEEGKVGLITYMRTDSLRIEDAVILEMRDLIVKLYGADYCPKAIRTFKSKQKNAQEAHEAIRPTIVSREPEKCKPSLDKDQFNLYRLIWQRTLASQMIEMKMAVKAIALKAEEVAVFRLTGSVILHQGWAKAYQSGDEGDQEKEQLLPDFKEGDWLEVDNFEGKQHFTEPPPRFRESSLIKNLEEHGIGRPSTYPSIIGTLLHREYVELEQKVFRPTDVGRVVNRFLTEYFKTYVDYAFTAQLEDQLDEISRGEKSWQPMLAEFWKPFNDLIAKIDAEVSRKDVTQEQLDEECPKCKAPLSSRLGRRGRFIGCTKYPDCDYTRSMDGEEGSSEPEVVEGRQCPKCSTNLVYKIGRYGKFIGCSAYPECKFIESAEKPKDIGVQCPTCKKANMLKRRSRRGSFFYGCADYPKCQYAVWYEPINKECPKCSWPILIQKVTKRKGEETVCPQKECGYSEPTAAGQS